MGVKRLQWTEIKRGKYILNSTGGENDEDVSNNVYYLNTEENKWEHKDEMVTGMTETTIHSSYAVINIDMESQWTKRKPNLWKRLSAFTYTRYTDQFWSCIFRFKNADSGSWLDCRTIPQIGKWKTKMRSDWKHLYHNLLVFR